MQVPAKRYEVLETLARGGMGEVSIAREQTGDLYERLVVLKTVLPDYAGDERQAKALLDEARVLAQLQHANIAQIYDVASRDGEICIVMEWLRGQNLYAIMRELQGDAMPPDVTVAVLLGAAAGLAYAHAAKDSRGRELGIVHRDVSPQNIFLTRDGSVKVIDFGIALSSARAQTTLHGVVKGKVAYMAPEQMRGLGADVRSDVWSLGVVAWELLTGKRLFRREADVVEAVLHGEIPPPSAIGAATDAELDAIVLSMLERDLMRRTPTCAAVHDALLRWSRDKRIPTPHELAAWLARVLEPERDAAPAPSAEATRTIRLSSAMAGGADARPREGASTATVGPPRASAREQTATVDPPARRAASSVAAPTREQTATVDPRARRPAATIGSPDAEDTATVDAPAPSPAGAPKVAARSRGRSARLAVASAVALAFGAVVVVGALVGAGALGSSSAGGDPEARVVPAVAPEPVVPRTVRFTVEGLPEGATVWLDGVAVAGSVAELAEGGSTHVLEVRDARGEVLLSRELVADANVRIPLIELPRAEAPSAAAADVPRPTPRRPRRPSRGSTLGHGIDQSYP